MNICSFAIVVAAAVAIASVVRMQGISIKVYEHNTLAKRIKLQI